MSYFEEVAYLIHVASAYRIEMGPKKIDKIQVITCIPSQPYHAISGKYGRTSSPSSNIFVVYCLQLYLIKTMRNQKSKCIFQKQENRSLISSGRYCHYQPFWWILISTHRLSCKQSSKGLETVLY